MQYLIDTHLLDIDAPVKLPPAATTGEESRQKPSQEAFLPPAGDGGASALPPAAAAMAAPTVAATEPGAAGNVVATAAEGAVPEGGLLPLELDPPLPLVLPQRKSHVSELFKQASLPSSFS